MSATQEMKDLAELIVRRMAEEQISPLNARIQSLEVRFARIETAVIGNGVPSLAKQIADVGSRCDSEHARIHQRISEKKSAGANEVSRNSRMRERLVGAWIALSSAGSIAFAGFQIWSFFKGGHR